MPYRLERVTGRRARRAFADVPRAVMAGMPAFVPPLTVEEVKQIDPARNPFFAHAESAFWILRDGGRPCGRVSATVDRLALDWNRDATGVFGHFLAPDERGAALLLDAARGFLASRGLGRMLGPIELSTNHTCGLQVTGFDELPRIQMNQHPPGQEALLLAQGLEPVKDLLAFRLHRDDADLERIVRGSQLAARRTGARVRNLDLRRFDAEVDLLHAVYEGAWAHNFGFVPASREEFVHAARGLRRIVQETLCQIAEVGGKAVGFIVGVPDVNVGIRACNGRLFPLGFVRLMRAVRRTDRFRVITLGILPEMRRTGLDSLLILEHVRRSVASGYHDAELSWVLEDNVAMVKQARTLGAKEAIRYRLYLGDTRPARPQNRSESPRA